LWPPRQTDKTAESLGECSTADRHAEGRTRDELARAMDDIALVSDDVRSDRPHFETGCER